MDAKSELADGPRKRLAYLVIGGTLASVCGFTAWLAFLLLTMFMNQALRGADYWDAVIERMENNSGLTALMLASLTGALAGLVLMILGICKYLATPRTAA